jgi:hypothetical protein
VILSLTFLVASLVIIGSCLLVYSCSWCLIDTRLFSLFVGFYISVRGTYAEAEVIDVMKVVGPFVTAQQNIIYLHRHVRHRRDGE